MSDGCLKIKAHVEFRDWDTKRDLESKMFAACKGMRYLNLKRNRRGMGKVFTNAILSEE